MKRVLIAIFLCLSFVSYGQRYPISTSAHLGGGEASEMISNGTFDDGTDWEVTSGWTITGGEAVYDGVDEFQSIYQADGNMVSSITTDTNYRLIFDAGEEGIRIRIYSSGKTVQYVDYATYSSGENIVDFTTPSNIAEGGIAFMASQTYGAGTIDNVSLKLR